MSEFSNWGKTVTRYVITVVYSKGSAAGMRTLALPQQGRYTWPTYLEAAHHLDNFKEPHGFPRIMSEDEIASLRIDPCECWDVHFDPCGVWFEN